MGRTYKPLSLEERSLFADRVGDGLVPPSPWEMLRNGWQPAAEVS